MSVRKFSTASIKSGVKSSKFWDQSTVIPNPVYESIATAVATSGGAGSVVFSSIPDTYTHLQIRALSRDNRNVGGNNNFSGYFNSDSTASNYYWFYMDGDGSTAYSGGVTNNSSIPLCFGQSGSDNTKTTTFASTVVDILDYANSNKKTTIRGITGSDYGTAGVVRYFSGLWNNTAAITQITLYPQSASSFTEYSHFALYGIKSA